MYEINDEELDAVKAVLLSKKLHRYQGKNIDTECSLFEREFAQHLGTSFSQIVTSGTSALELALKLLKVGPGDEVIVPCYTFFATPLAVIQSGASPVLVNIDDQLSLSVTEVEQKITSKTKAIIAVHMDGFQCDMDSLMKLSEKHKIPVIEDAAQAIGGSFHGKKLGSIGDFGCFSFNVEKIISCGEGGAITSKYPDLQKKTLLMHDTCAQFGITHKEELASLQMTGLSMRVSEISGALMRVQLRKLEMILHNLRGRKNLILGELDKEDIIVPHDPKGECATTIHLKTSDPMAAVDISKDLAGLGVRAFPLMLRPGHFYWQWMNLLNCPEDTARALSKSRMYLSSLVRIQVPYDVPVEETLLQGRTIRKVLEKWSPK